ncbi:MAG: phage tail assembly protein [Candidatus Binataceae bacterium]
MRRPTGRDLRMAERAAKDDGKTAQGFALLARVTTISGRQLVLEDIDAMDLADINVLSEAIAPHFLSASASSPSSSNADSD